MSKNPIKVPPASKPLLPADTTAALNKMTRVTRDVRVIVEKERDALAAQDAGVMKTVIAQKGDIAGLYETASREFHERLAEFQSADPAAVEELKREHQELAQLTAENSIEYNRIIGAKRN